MNPDVINFGSAVNTLALALAVFFLSKALVILMNFVNAAYRLGSDILYRRRQNRIEREREAATINAGEDAARLDYARDEEVLLTKNEKALINAGRIIDAIKEVRCRTGLGLKEAKDRVDAHRNQYPRR